MILLKGHEYIAYSLHGVFSVNRVVETLFVS